MPAPLIEFPADDAERARRFWSGVLGTELAPRTAEAGSGWEIEDDGLRLGMHERGRGPGDRACLPYFTVADLGATLKRVRELGGSVIHPGERWAVCRDSEGSPFALAAAPRGRAVAATGHDMAARMSQEAANRAVARTALEEVCSRGDLDLAGRCYSEQFVDHVGPLEYHGIDGIGRSTAFYRSLLADLAFEVVDQVAEDDRVANRYVVTGTNRGRSVRLSGITISRLENERIVEDWSAFDSLELLRQLGLVRSILAAPLMLRALRDARRR
jgi:predicted enzyme related to lactoylglutathione lyase/predicted ester cyclase